MRPHKLLPLSRFRTCQAACVGNALGQLTLPVCLSWEQQKGFNCFGATSAAPGTRSKCVCKTVVVPEISVTGDEWIMYSVSSVKSVLDDELERNYTLERPTPRYPIKGEHPRLTKPSLVR